MEFYLQKRLSPDVVLSQLNPVPILHFVYLTSLLILLFYLSLRFPSHTLLHYFPTERLYALFIFHIRATCTVYRILLHLLTLINWPVHNFLHPCITSYLRPISQIPLIYVWFQVSGRFLENTDLVLWVMVPCRNGLRCQNFGDAFFVLDEKSHKVIWDLFNISYIYVHGERFLAPRWTPKLWDHPLSAVHDKLFNIFAVTALTLKPFLQPHPENIWHWMRKVASGNTLSR
jgi:hypothetical protein